jgi:hypothetical protein
MQRIVKFVVVAQLHAKTIQNCLLAAIDGGLLIVIILATSVSVRSFQKQLFDQPAPLSGQRPDSTAHIAIPRCV